MSPALNWIRSRHGLPDCLQPRANIINADFAKADLPQHFDLAIGNPPFSDRIVRSDPAFRKLGASPA